MTPPAAPSSRSDAPNDPHAAAGEPTLWGLSIGELHDRFWTSRGIQVVRMGQPSAIVPQAELFLLTDARTLVLFRPAPILDQVSWLAPDLISVRLLDRRKRGYAERVESDPDGRFRRVTRVYAGSDPQLTRIGLTTDPELAKIWQAETHSKLAWRRFRRALAPQVRYSARLEGRVFDSSILEDRSRYLKELIRWWQRPDATIDGIQTVAERVWSMNGDGINSGTVVRGPLWIGAGRNIPSGSVAIGPGVLWDAPDHRPTVRPVAWQDIEPRQVPTNITLKRQPSSRRPFKRLFDVVASLAAILLTLPLYPIVALLIALEDGFPIFFAHERETIGGKTFGCIKFRSMRKDAEKLKAELAAKNKADGPQFYIPDDPRLTRVGKIIRDLQIDELPQFFNVLAGDMSIVGPRPSPFKENQFCPAWREARLSVRPGITGLWQISRTRETGSDFQEWIRFDIEYVERQSFFLDLWIIWRTILLILRKAATS